MKQTRKTSHPSIHAVRKALNANDQLSKVSIDEHTGWITFTFWSHSANGQKNFDVFEMNKDCCDYTAFDEFAYQCIKGFDSESMSDAEIVKRANAIYRITSRLYRKQSDFFSFIGRTQKMMSERITNASRSHASIAVLCFI